MSNRSLVFAVAVLSAVASVSASERYHVVPVALKSGTIVSDTVPAGSGHWTFHCRVNPPRAAYCPRWSVIVSDQVGTCGTITLERKGMKAADSDYEPAVNVMLTDRDGNEAKRFVIDRGIDPSTDGWSLVLEKFSGRDSIGCRIGQRSAMLDFMLSPCEGAVSISLVPENEVGLSRMSLICGPAAGCRPAKFGSVEELESYLTMSEDPAECQWRYLDRDTDQRLLNIGGDYRLATVSRENGEYDIIYLGGARVNGSFWKPLMIKGRLIPTPFRGHYDLEWYDAYGQSVNKDASATIEAGTILTLNFPLQGGTVRFALSSSSR